MSGGSAFGNFASGFNNVVQGLQGIIGVANRQKTNTVFGQTSNARTQADGVERSSNTQDLLAELNESIRQTQEGTTDSTSDQTTTTRTLNAETIEALLTLLLIWILSVGTV